VLGGSGAREDAEESRAQLEECLRESLTRARATDTTLRTQARTEAARFLGSARVTRDADDPQDHRGQRCINGVRGLQGPVEVIKAQCSRDMPRGTPIHRAARLAEIACRSSTP